MSNLGIRIAPSFALATLLLSACGGGDQPTTNQPSTTNLPPAVYAGSDQVAATSSVVTLNGTASDSDGSISSYSWTQTAGDTVNLTNANAASTSFTMPNSAANGALRFKLTATDNLGKSASDTVTISLTNSSDETVNITGTVTFDLVPFDTSTNGLDYNQTQVAPARGVVVEAIDLLGNKINATITDSNGKFSLQANTHTNLRIRISASLLQTTDAIWDVKVTDNTNGNALYATQSDLFNSSTQDTTRDFHMASGWTGSNYSATRAAAPFAILDAIYDSMQKVVVADPSVVFPPLEIHWSTDNSVAQGNSEDGDIGTSFYQDGKIYVLGKQDSDTDEYDRHIITHEWGHYFEDRLSRSESLGGDHGDGERLDMRVAFSEGWGNALSAIVTDDSFYRDSSGYRQSSGWQMNMEDNPTSDRGWFSESSVQSILYDLYDTNADGTDNIALGFEPIYASLTNADYLNNPYFSSIYTFIDQLKTQQPAYTVAINSLLNAQQIYGAGSDGANETNDGNISSVSVLPVYNNISVGANSGLCYTNEAGVYNKLGNRIFLAFDVAMTGPYSFSLTPKTETDANSDPDLGLFKSGTLIAKDDSETSNGKANITTNLNSTGIHILEVSVWEESSPSNPETKCFNLQISN